MKKTAKKLFAMIGAVVAIVSTFAVTASAATSELPSGVVSAYTDGVSSVQAGIFEMIGIALPYALGVLVVTIAITFGIKFFKRITGRS